MDYVEDRRSKYPTSGLNCNCQTSEGGASRAAMVALVSTSKTLRKLSREADAGSFELQIVGPPHPHGLVE
ncbi:hypothetical protein SAY87_007038 [Trapa incisa]|uniref:Uncharacterized protein n=1 Tax=Trapa incisa TaxID=236973 RepID=A0AAN7JZM8_9MYRT|nr:hypothetical protein SAY87_007038 [Trapa incisa]